MKNTVKVRFKEGGQTYDFSNEIEGLEVGDILAVKSGPEDKLSAVEVVSIHRKFHDWNKPTLFQFDISEIENLDLQFSLKQVSDELLLAKDYKKVSNLEICQYLVENGRNMLVIEDFDDGYILLGLENNKVEIVNRGESYYEDIFEKYFSEELNLDEYFYEDYRGGLKEFIQQPYETLSLLKKFSIKFKKDLYLNFREEKEDLIKEEIKKFVLNHVSKEVDNKDKLRFFWKNGKDSEDLDIMKEVWSEDDTEVDFEASDFVKDLLKTICQKLILKMFLILN